MITSLPSDGTKSLEVVVPPFPSLVSKIVYRNPVIGKCSRAYAPRTYTPRSLWRTEYEVSTIRRMRLTEARQVLYGVDCHGTIHRYFQDDFPLDSVETMIVHPLRTPALVTIKAGKILTRRHDHDWSNAVTFPVWLGVGYFLWHVALAYERIFANPGRYEVDDPSRRHLTITGLAYHPERRFVKLRVVETCR